MTAAADATRILLIDRDETAATGLTAALAATWPQATVARAADVAAGLRAGPAELLLVDLPTLATDMVAAEAMLARLARHAASALIVVLAETASTSAALGLMRAGAHDVATRGDGPGALAQRIAALAERHGRRLGPEPDAPQGLEGMLGCSPQMQAVFAQLQAIAAADGPVFVTGEPGTGKRLAATALHRLGARNAGPFLLLDCHRGLAEADLLAAFARAGGGTLVLAEIGGLDTGLQLRLLQLLGNGAMARSGETLDRHSAVRLVCTSGRNPMQLIAERRFREDLFYRLHVQPLHLPPLRQRPGDVALLARRFARHFAAAEHRPTPSIAPSGLALLGTREFPGNVAELATLLHRAVLMGEGEIDAARLAAADFEGARTARQSPAVLPLWQQEQRIIEDAIVSFGGNIALAAAALELSPSTIYRKRQAWAEAERGAA